MAAAPAPPVHFANRSSTLINRESISKMKEEQLVNLFESQMKRCSIELLRAIKNYQAIPTPMLNNKIGTTAKCLKKVLTIIREIQGRSKTPKSSSVLAKLKQIWSNLFRRTLEWELRLQCLLEDRKLIDLVNAGGLMDMIPDEFESLIEDSSHQMIRTAIALSNLKVAAFYVTNIKAKKWRQLYMSTILAKDSEAVAHALRVFVRSDARAALKLALTIPDTVPTKATVIADVCKKCDIFTQVDVVWSFVDRFMLNPKYPYNPGHVLLLPKEHRHQLGPNFPLCWHDVRYILDPNLPFCKQDYISYSEKRGTVRTSYAILRLQGDTVYEGHEEQLSNCDIIVSEVSRVMKYSGCWGRKHETTYFIKTLESDEEPH